MLLILLPHYLQLIMQITMQNWLVEGVVGGGGRKAKLYEGSVMLPCVIYNSNRNRSAKVAHRYQ